MLLYNLLHFGGKKKSEKQHYNEAWLRMNGHLHFRLLLYQMSNLMEDVDVCAQVRGKTEGINI